MVLPSLGRRPLPRRAIFADDRTGGGALLKLLIAIVLLAHGIGHSMGLLGMFNVAVVNPEWRGDSWILTGTAGATATQAVGVMLWTIAIVGFALLAAVVLGWLPEAWFAALAVTSAIASLAGIVFFPIAFPVLSTIGALLVDVIVLANVLWYHWVPSDLAA